MKAERAEAARSTSAIPCMAGADRVDGGADIVSPHVGYVHFGAGDVRVVVSVHSQHNRRVVAGFRHRCVRLPSHPLPYFGVHVLVVGDDNGVAAAWSV